MYGGTDFYFASLVQVDDISQLKLCERELANHEWVDLGKIEEFCKSHSVRGTQHYLLTYLAELHQKSISNPNHRVPIRGGDAQRDSIAHKHDSRRRQVL